MRRAAAFLALLLCLYWTRAQGESGGVTENDITQTDVQSEILGVKATSDQTNITPDIWAELKELRDLVIRHSLDLRKIEKLETETSSKQTTLDQLRREKVQLENFIWLAAAYSMTAVLLLSFIHTHTLRRRDTYLAYIESVFVTALHFRYSKAIVRPGEKKK